MAVSERGRYTSRAHRTARFVAQQLMLKPAVWGLVDVTVHGRERLRDLSDPYIVVSNHSSHLDSPLIIGALPRRLSRHLATGAAADYFFESFWRRAPTSLFFNAFPVERGFSQRQRGERGSRARGMSGHLLNDGVPLLLFPEGTRSRTKAMGRFTPGVAALCISRNVPCLPVALVGAALAMPRGASLPRWGRSPVHVVFGDPMWAEPGETAHKFSERISGCIRELHDTTALAVGLPRMQDYEQAALTGRKTGDQESPDDKESQQ